MVTNVLNNLILIFLKIKKKIWEVIVSKSRKSVIHEKLYLSYWHMLFNKSNFNTESLNYYTAQPNPGAGIGHQMANWIAGFWYAKQFRLNYAYSNFSNNYSKHLENAKLYQKALDTYLSKKENRKR